MSPLITILFTITNLTVLEVSLFRPSFFWWALFISLFMNIFFVWIATRMKFNKNFYNFLISPFLFWLGGLFFIGFLNNALIGHLVILFLVVANSYFIYHLFILTYERQRYKQHSLSNISRIINLSSLFFWFTSLFDIYVFLKVPFIVLAIAAAIVVYLTDYQFFVINKIHYSSAKLFIITAMFISVELFYVLSWLPIMATTKGILMVSVYYFINSLSKYHLQGALANSVYLRYSIITGIIWLITLITSRLE